MNVISVPTYSQRDPLWFQEKLGFSRVTIGEAGCAVTALAMLLEATHADAPGSPHTPVTVNERLRKIGGFSGPARNLISWPSVTAAWPKLMLYDRIDCPNRRMKRHELEQIDQRLGKRIPVIAYVDGRAQEIGIQQHFVLIVGRDDEACTYLINDPWFGDQAGLTPRYGIDPPVALCGLILFDPSLECHQS